MSRAVGCRSWRGPQTADNSRLSVDDWIQAGFAILAEEGIKALKIDRLCASPRRHQGQLLLALHRHARYRAALVEAWGELRDDDRRHFDDLAGLPPRERLSEMMSSLVSPAALDAGAGDARVGPHRRSRRRQRARRRPRVLAAVRQAFLDYGFDAEEADLRANATFAAGIGFLHLAGPQPGARGAAAAANGFLETHAQAPDRQISILKSMVASPACRPPGFQVATARTITRSSSPGWPSARSEAEQLRELPAATVDRPQRSGFTELLVPARFGGPQADFPAILDPVRRMAHGCTSSAWTIGFYALHNWMLALFGEQAQEEAFATRRSWRPPPWRRPAAACPSTAASG